MSTCEDAVELLAGAESILLVDASSVTVRLVENGSWAHTTVEANVIDVTDRPTECGVGQGARIAMQFPAGVIPIRGVTVRVGMSGWEPLASGRRYLVDVECATSPFVRRYWMVDRAGRLRDQSNGRGWMRHLNGQAVEDVIRALRRVRAQR